MDTETLRCFAFAGRSGSLTATAEQMHLSQSSVSRRISSLEEELHVQLLRRSGAGTALTSEGEILLPFAEDAIKKVNDLQEMADRCCKAKAGVIRISCFGYMDRPLIEEMYDDVKKTFPDVSLYVEKNLSVIAAKLLREKKIDIALCTMCDVHAIDGLVFDVLDDAYPVILLRRDHPWAKRPLIQMEELRGTSFYMHAEHINSWQLLKETPSAGRELYTSMEAHSCKTIDEMTIRVMTESGIAVTCSSIHSDMPDSLTTVRLNGFPLDLRYVLAYRRNQKDPIKRFVVQSLLEHGKRWHMTVYT